jgi:hypothetical protein
MCPWPSSRSEHIRCEREITDPLGSLARRGGVSRGVEATVALAPRSFASSSPSEAGASTVADDHEGHALELP